jgi:hypothetical protein
VIEGTVAGGEADEGCVSVAAAGEPCFVPLPLEPVMVLPPAQPAVSRQSATIDTAVFRTC